LPAQNFETYFEGRSFIILTNWKSCRNALLVCSTAKYCFKIIIGCSPIFFLQTTPSATMRNNVLPFFE